MAKLSPAMIHVLSRCSLVEDWDRSGCCLGRQWPDLVAGFDHCAYSTIRALVRRGLLRERDGLFGLTPAGCRTWLEIRPTKDSNHG